MTSPLPSFLANATEFACARAPKTFLNQDHCVRAPACGDALFETCGSPGEVASDPTKGALYAKQTQHALDADATDDWGEGRYSLDAPSVVTGNQGRNNGRSTVWYPAARAEIWSPDFALFSSRGRR